MAGEPELVFEANVVGPAFFETVGIPLVEGRPFTSGDVEGTPRAVVVSASAARRLWPGESPLGKQLVVRSGGELPLQVIGVVKDVRHGRIIRGRTMMRPTTANVYLPLFQRYISGITLFVRTIGDQDAIAAALRREIQALDRYLPFEMETFHTHVSGLLAGPRAATAVMEICSLFVLVLAVSGLYGLVAYSVSRRTREFGVRIALGAQSRDVVGLVVRQGMLQVLWGVALGLIMAAVLSRILNSLLFEVTAFDPILFLALSLLLAGVGAAACYFPARRATRVNPILALKSE